MSVPMDFTNMDELSSDDDSDDASEEEVEEEEENVGDGKESQMAKSKDEDDEDANSDTVESDDDDEDDDDDNDEDDEALKAEISNLQSILSSSPFHYDSHVALIKACRKIGDLAALRGAREKMAASFPLTPELWQEWIADERRIIDEGDASDTHAENGTCPLSLNSFLSCNLPVMQL